MAMAGGSPEPIRGPRRAIMLAVVAAYRMAVMSGRDHHQALAASERACA